VAAELAPARAAERPDPERVAAYRRLRELFADAYRRLEPWFETLADEALAQ